jgi:predicted DNA-binding WGR domain protein
MNDLRTKLIRLAHEKPELRAQLLPLIKEAGEKVAHKPHIREINRNTNKAGISSMIYHIDAEANKSKFHEMYVDGSTLKRVWGALTDRGGFGKTRSKNETYASPEAALRDMGTIKNKKIRDGYIDAYGRFHRTPDGKALPQGQYPVGLTRSVGFGWGTQESAFCIPVLKRLQEDLAKHQAVLSRTLPSSDMGKKILGQIKTLTRYLDKQMSLCG